MVTTSTGLPVAEIAAGLRLSIVRTSRRLRQDALDAEGRGVLSPTLNSALATVDVHGPLTPSELAERERIRRPTVSRIVSSLVDLGLASRTPDPADGRGCLIATTPEGAALMKRLRKRKNAYLAKRMRDLDPDEVETLARASEILERLLDSDSVTRT
jgi:DNA-binding MarR family transcriptional regulator